METLMSYDWPGTVCELQNCIERMSAMNSGPLLHIHDLPSTLQTHRLAHDAGALAVAAVAATGPEALRSPAQSGIISLKEMEKRAISATPWDPHRAIASWLSTCSASAVPLSIAN